MDGCPEDLKPYIESYKIRKKMQDEQMWLMGIYVREAVGVTIANCFSKHSKAKYYEKPILQNEKQPSRKLKKTERKKGQEQLMMKLKLMQDNFEIAHNK